MTTGERKKAHSIRLLVMLGAQHIENTATDEASREIVEFAKEWLIEQHEKSGSL